MGKLFVRVANSPRLLTLTAVLILVVCSSAYSVAERKDLLEATWWAIITATTVGYGDAYPRSNFGRGVAIALVVSMVLFFIPMVTASFASRLIVNRDAFTHEEQEEIKQGVHEILRKLDQR